jgi:DHA2 family multidrug resistance protein
MSGLSAAGFSPEQILTQINLIVNQQAFTMAADDIFYVSALLFVLLIPVVWLSHPQRGGAGASAAAGAH